MMYGQGLHALIDRVLADGGGTDAIELHRSMQFGNERYVAQRGNTRWVTPRLLWDRNKGEEYFDPDDEWSVFDRPPPETIWVARDGEHR